MPLGAQSRDWLPRWKFCLRRSPSRGPMFFAGLWQGTWPATRACRVPTPSPTCGCSWAGAPNAGSEPLAAQRPHIELYIRWMQEVRRFKPSTVSRRISIVAGFYRTCVIDEVLPTSPAEHVRRPNAPPESPTLGLTHLQFEACSQPRANQPTPTTSPWSPCSGCSACGSSKPPALTSPTSARNTDTVS
jgi:hypothetical protein